MRVWSAAAARNRFGNLVDAAMADGPQLVRRRDGCEVVVLGREAWEASRPTLLEVLMASAGEAGDDDPLDRAWRVARAQGAFGAATLRDVDFGRD